MKMSTGNKHSYFLNDFVYSFESEHMLLGSKYARMDEENIQDKERFAR